ncbi:MAG TPA: DUF4153 domain-containing protein [Oscillospiraceae bacterium]|nr:DUF4153 domain-containing protein [Oscillospiraceae bacterium]
MNMFARSVSNVLKGAWKAFRTFPASLGCALAFAVVTAIRIQLDWPQQEPFNFLFGCLHWAFALGAVFSLAAVTAAQSRSGTARASLGANLLGAAAALATFLGLYFFGAQNPLASGYATVSSLAAARVGAAILVSLIAFIILSGEPDGRAGFASSLFMAHKAFFIALLYGLVILAGASGVARAVQALLYPAMSEKVYMYIGTIAGFLAFSIFTGYFPDFHKGVSDPRRETARRQPRFIEVLFGYIMVPLALALTVVLLIWAGKTVLGGMQVSFVRLSAISAAYTLGGLWLHAMVAAHGSAPAKLYRRVYPVASLFILVFEAWAVVNQLRDAGLKLTEYAFILVWVLAALGSVLLLLQKSRAHRTIAVFACVLTVVSVLPLTGYHALPVSAQLGRLETLLTGEGMLSGGELTPAASEPDEAVRIAVTDAVDYLAGASDAKLPAWFDKDLDRSDVFRAKLGFEKTWKQSESPTEPGQYLGTYLSLPAGAVEIGGYRWALNPQEESGKGEGPVTVSGDRGAYQIDWTASDRGVPSLRITLDGQTILDEDLSAYLGALFEKYPPGQAGSVQAAPEDMSLRFETAEADVLLVFSNVSVTVDTVNDTVDYWVVLRDLYLKENP